MLAVVLATVFPFKGKEVWVLQIVADVFAKLTIGFLITFSVNCFVSTAVQGKLLDTLTSITTVVLEASGVNIGVAVLDADKVPAPETICHWMDDALWLAKTALNCFGVFSQKV